MKQAKTFYFIIGIVLTIVIVASMAMIGLPSSMAQISPHPTPTFTFTPGLPTPTDTPIPPTPTPLPPTPTDTPIPPTPTFTPVPPDVDNDGVVDAIDFCPATAIPEDVPTVELKPNRWALVDGDNVFDTVTKGKGNGPGRSYTTADTGGCSCEQIIEAEGLGNGHTKHGCSIGAMDNWIASLP